MPAEMPDPRTCDNEMHVYEDIVEEPKENNVYDVIQGTSLGNDCIKFYLVDVFRN